MPLFSRLSDDALLLQAEASGKSFKESLISALEFSRMEIGEHENISRGMIRETIETGERASESIRLDEVFRLGRLRLNLFALGLLAAAFAGLCAREASLPSHWESGLIVMSCWEMPSGHRIISWILRE